MAVLQIHISQKRGSIPVKVRLGQLYPPAPFGSLMEVPRNLTRRVNPPAAVGGEDSQGGAHDAGSCSFKEDYCPLKRSHVESAIRAYLPLGLTPAGCLLSLCHSVSWLLLEHPRLVSYMKQQQIQSQES